MEDLLCTTAGVVVILLYSTHVKSLLLAPNCRRSAIVNKYPIILLFFQRYFIGRLFTNRNDLKEVPS